MKRRRNFSLLLADIDRSLADPKRQGRSWALWESVWDVGNFIDALAGDVAKTRELLMVVRAVRASSGPGQTGAEESLLGHLQSIARRCRKQLQPDGTSELPGFDETKSSSADTQAAVQILRELGSYAMECFQFKRARDSFGGRRRAEAFQILTIASRVLEMPEAMVLARELVRKSRGTDVLGAIEFLYEYHACRDIAPDDELVKWLLKLAERTSSRSNAVAALDLLVQTGVIDEIEAICTMDDWKARHHR